MKHRKTFLGVGWKFPPEFDKSSGSVILVSEEEDIKESLEILLSTKKGERIMMPDYGCNLHHLVFESINADLINRLRNMIEASVTKYEPRITLNNVDIRPDANNDGALFIIIDYTINKTNQSNNMVYPYYIIEGNDTRYRPI